MSARVNQKLHFARLALDCAAQQDDDIARQALTEAALFHLMTAYRSYLREILAVGHHDFPADTAQQAQRQLPADNAFPELDELVKLERDDEWPARLIAAYTTIAAPVTPRPPKRSPHDTSVIAFADVTGVLDATDCRAWLQAFQQLLQRQREQAQEY